MMAWIFGTNYWENACRRLAFLANIFILFPSSLFSMTRLALFFLAFFSIIPSLWAHHYQVFMPIILNPAENNLYLDRHHMNSVYSRGFHFHFDDFYEGATTPKMQMPLQGVFPYLCIAPKKDGISLMTEVSTIPIRSYSRDESLLTKKQTVSGFLDKKAVQAAVNLAFFGWDDWLPSFRHNAGFACSYARNDEEYWYSRDKITKDDTISLRIQYPVGTEISLPH